MVRRSDDPLARERNDGCGRETWAGPLTAARKAPLPLAAASLLGLLCLSASPARAQGTPGAEAPPAVPVTPGEAPPPAVVAPVSPAPTVVPAPVPPSTSTAAGYVPYPDPPAAAPAPAPYALPPPPPPPPMPSDAIRRFKAGRVLYGLGTATGLIGGGLTVASIGLAIAYGTSGPTGDYSRAFAYAGSASSGVSVIFGAVGLGLQHSALRQAGNDTGRGLYAVGTLLGLVGLAGVGASYYIDLAKPVENPEKVAFGVSVAATALLITGGILYFADERRMYHVYRRLMTF